MKGLLDDAVQRGAKVVVGGAARAQARQLFSPTVLVDLPPDAPVLQEETDGTTSF